MRGLAPKVTVCVVTYNQEQYITSCLQSIVEQKTDFDFEVIVSDDCSTDRTREFLKEFSNKYPFIQLILRDKNIGALANFVDTHQRARGRYISHIDGDDIMYQRKLQKQSDILDKMPFVAIAAHPVKVMGSRQIMGLSKLYPEIGDMYDLLRLGMYFTNGSSMYRRKDRFNSHISGPTIDFYRFIELSSCGKIFLDNEVLGEYRVHEEGISKNNKFFKQINFEYERAFSRAIELGGTEIKVEQARAHRQMKVAISFLLASDFQNFHEFISIQREKKLLCKTHRILYRLRNYKFILKLIVLIHRLKKYVD